MAHDKQTNIVTTGRPNASGNTPIDAHATADDALDTDGKAANAFAGRVVNRVGDGGLDSRRAHASFQANDDPDLKLIIYSPA